MTSTLTGTRQEIADAVRATVGDDVAVWAAVPSNVTAPGVAVVLDTGAREAGCVWSVRWRVLCVAPGGDNTAAVTALDDLITAVVGALQSALHGAVLTWDPPEQLSSAGVPYLTQTVNAEIPVEVKDVTPWP